jgi:hypothetical protein
MLIPLALFALLPAHAPESSSLAGFDPAFAYEPSLQTAGAPAGTGPYASNFSYTWAEIDYRYVDSAVGGDSVDGFALRGSYAINPNISLLGSYSRLSDNGDLDEFRLGAGYNTAVSDRIDVFGSLSYVRQEFDFDSNDDTENGFAAEVGARFWLNDKVEINNKLEYRDVEDNGWGVGIGARYYVTPTVSLGGEFETITGDEDLLLGVRFQR